MTITNIVNLARDKSNTNSNTFSDEKFLLYFQAKVPQFQSDVELVNEDHMGSVDYRDLRATGTGTYTDGADTLYTREYNLPSDMLNKLKSVFAKLDGTNWTWLPELQEVDEKILFEDEDTIKETYGLDSSTAGYFIFRGSLFIVSGEIEEAVTGGLVLWNYSYSDLPTTMPTAGSEADVDLSYYGIPKSLHETFAVALSVEWKSNQSTPVPLTAEEQKYYAVYNNKDRFKDLKNMNRSRAIIFDKPANPYDNGFNL
jgi:hypothetical protein